MDTTTKISFGEAEKSSLTFIRNVFYKKGKHTISIVVQPYIVGMYVAITDSKVPKLIQLNIPHNEYKDWLNGVLKKLKGGKYTTADYTQFLSLEEIKKYDIFSK